MSDRITSEFPLLSCLCVSTDRPQFLESSIKSFLSQSYPNKELVVVSRNLETYKKLVTRYESDQIRFFDVDKKKEETLGDLRNRSIKEAKGEYFCNWDDDDWYHNRRLERQFDAIKKSCKLGSILAYCLLFDKTSNKCYLSYPMFHPATIMVKKSLINDLICYSSLDKDEDGELIVKLFRANVLFPLIDPTLYIYVYHGGNTWNASHFSKFYAQSALMDDASSKEISRILNEYYSIEEASEILSGREILGGLNYFGNSLMSV